MGMNCYNTLRVFPLMVVENGENELADFWCAFTEEDEGSISFTLEKLISEPETGFDSEWRISNWGTTLILEGTYRGGSEKQEFTTKNSPPHKFFELVSEKYPALVFFLECTIPEDNSFAIGFFAGGRFVTGQHGEIYDDEHIKKNAIR